MRIAARNIAILLAALFILALSFVQFQQRLLRHRAEELFNDIQNFQIRPSNFADLEKFQQRWGSHAHYEGTCTIEHCVYQVDLTDSLDAFVYRRYGENFHWLSGVYHLMSGHADFIHAAVKLYDDRIWGTEYDFYAHDDVYLREAIHFGPHLFPYGFLQSDELRNEYAVGGASNYKENLDLYITPQTPLADLRRLSSLNFSCMTRISPCDLAKDIMPEIATDPLRGRSSREEMFHVLTKAEFNCDAPTALFAREAENIVEVDVLEVHPDRNSNETPPPSQARVRILRQMKHAKPQAISSEWEVNLNDEDLSTQSVSSPAVRSLIAGQHYFIFFSQPIPGQERGHLYLEPCSAYPATDSVYFEINKGVAMDALSGGPLE